MLIGPLIMSHNVCYRKAKRAFFPKLQALRTRLRQKLSVEHSICKVNLYQPQVTPWYSETERETSCEWSEHDMGTHFYTLYLLPLLFVLGLLSSTSPPYHSFLGGKILSSALPFYAVSSASLKERACIFFTVSRWFS